MRPADETMVRNVRIFGVKSRFKSRFSVHTSFSAAAPPHQSASIRAPITCCRSLRTVREQASGSRQSSPKGWKMRGWHFSTAQDAVSAVGTKNATASSSIWQ